MQTFLMMRSTSRATKHSAKTATDMVNHQTWSDMVIIKDHFTMEVIPSVHEHSSLEIIPVVVRHLSFRFCIVAFYRPTTPLLLILYVSSFLVSFTIFCFSHFILLAIGDFNVNVRNPSHHIYQKFCKIADIYSLSQVVSSDTHISSNSHSSLIYLVLTSS